MDSFLPRLLLALAYPGLAHWATHGGGAWAEVVALTDLALVVLVDGLMRRHPVAWLSLAAIVAVLALSAGTPLPRLLLLAPPMLFTGLAAWVFARSLGDPRGALITRIVEKMERCDAGRLAPALRRYTRRLSLAWAGVLGLLCAINGVLAMVAVPDGALALLGISAPVSISREQWSLFANLLNYGLVGVFFIGEYLLRRRLFAERPYRDFLEFLRMMAGLGPDFWRELFSRPPAGARRS